MSARPGRVREIFRIPFSHPRSLALKHDPRFMEIEDLIRRLVEQKPERMAVHEY